ncbi:hypothetical protein SAMN05444320_107253 [Streptoalloteichus hindustanus]|uniref:Uncharacterized protein n=2 Tax=Streptoalloteichus hindustanus TaxID=2017 RepID=A0A1M5IF09_STRHI|nr:hypothetical protein SAMN05444320_107253 [Streptoalloteichus hindustanus]
MSSIPELEVLCDRRMVVLHGEQATGEFDTSGNPDPLFATADDAIYVFSGGSHHYARFAIQLWDSAPPQSNEPWERVEYGLVTMLETPEHELWPDEPGPTVSIVDAQLQQDLTTGERKPFFLQFPSHGHYVVRGHVRGFDEATRLPEATYAHGVEQWLLQLWPTDQQPTPMPLPRTGASLPHSRLPHG